MAVGAEIEPKRAREMLADIATERQATPPKFPPEDRVVLNFPLNSETRVRVVAAGQFGPREIGRLIQILKLHQEFLLEDAAETDPENPG